jgi:Cu(I)/Ag(I) efflux system periplasmic protein CusF
MKTAIATVFIALVATFSVPSMAAGEHEGHGTMAVDMKMQSQAPADTKMVDGTVKKVDKAAGKVTLSHGPLTNLGMNMAMTMAFRVQDPSWLDQLKVGDKIRFVADSVNGALTVVKYEPAK